MHWIVQLAFFQLSPLKNFDLPADQGPWIGLSVMTVENYKSDVAKNHFAGQTKLKIINDPKYIVSLMRDSRNLMITQIRRCLEPDL